MRSRGELKVGRVPLIAEVATRPGTPNQAEETRSNVSTTTPIIAPHAGQSRSPRADDPGAADLSESQVSSTRTLHPGVRR